MVENIFLTGIVIALCQVVKIYVESRWIPLIALVLGVAGAFGLAVGVGEINPAVTTFQGLISGLVAVGVYSGAKNTIQTSP